MFLAKFREKLIVGAAILFLPTIAKATCNSMIRSHDNNDECHLSSFAVARYNPAVTSWCAWSPLNSNGCSEIDVLSQRRNYGFTGAGCIAPVLEDSGWMADGTTTAASPSCS